MLVLSGPKPFAPHAPLSHDRTTLRHRHLIARAAQGGPEEGPAAPHTPHPPRAPKPPMEPRGFLGSFLPLLLRGGLAAGAVVVAARERWAMAAADEKESPNPPSRAKGALESLESLFGEDPKEKTSPPVAPPTQPTDTSGPPRLPRAKGALQSLESLFGEDPKEKVEPPVAPGSQAADSSPAAPNAAPTKDEKVQAMSDDVKKRLTSLQSGKDVEDLRFQTKALVDLVISTELQRRIPPDVVRRMREEVLGPAGFLVKRSEDAREFPRSGFVGGHLFRGQTRADLPTVIADALRRAKEVFPTKYEVIVIPEPPQYVETFEDPEDLSDRPAFLLVAAEEVEEGPVTRVQYGVAVALAFFTVLAIYFTGVGVGLTQLDPKTLQGFVDANDAEGLQGLFETNLPAISSAALPVAGAILASAAAHEVAHRVVAGASGVRMGLPYFLPSLSLGSFGAITRLRSLAANHAQLFDICAAGPVAGAVVALATFLAGLSLTTSAASGDPSLVSLPRELLESSFLLGGLVQGSLGEGARLCHPLVLAGWCGMVASALNLLPIGSTDGGRITQAAFGTATKQVASLVAYILLALDLLGPGVGFTFGVLSIFVQRGTERNIRDQFTTLDPGRRAAAALLLVMATLVLFPDPSALLPPGGSGF